MNRPPKHMDAHPGIVRQLQNEPEIGIMLEVFTPPEGTDLHEISMADLMPTVINRATGKEERPQHPRFSVGDTVNINGTIDVEVVRMYVSSGYTGIHVWIMGVRVIPTAKA